MANIVAIGYAYDWSPDWYEAVRLCEAFGNADSLVYIDKHHLPRRWKAARKSPYVREKYWHIYWRNKCFGYMEKEILQNPIKGRL
jgi:hypothetical protein